VLLLLPPSETKQIGGTGLTISQVHLSYGQLNEARDQILASLLEVSANKDLGSKVLKLSKRQLEDLDRNLEIPNAPTMAAFERYTGTLYKAIGVNSFSTNEVENMRRHILIQSALFGLISATDRIPWYRLSAETRLPDLEIKRVWNEHQPKAWERLVDSPIIDLRSKSYVELSPVPENLESFWVEVVSEVDGKRKALNHFNKKAKGDLVGAFVRQERPAQTLKELANLAKKVGLKLTVEENKIILVTPETL